MATENYFNNSILLKAINGWQLKYWVQSENKRIGWWSLTTRWYSCRKIVTSRIRTKRLCLTIHSLWLEVQTAKTGKYKGCYCMITRQSSGLSLTGISTWKPLAIELEPLRPKLTKLGLCNSKLNSKKTSC